jgi:cytoskeletal protein RodZ
MKVRITAGPASSPRLAVLGCAALMVLVAFAVSACTGSPSSTVPSIFSPSGSSSESSSSSGTATSSASADASASTSTTTPSTHTTTPTPTATTVSPSPVPTTTYVYPTGAPQTGGGATAGLQDGLVFVLGGAAIAAGLGSLVYRRKFTRRR